MKLLAGLLVLAVAMLGLTLISGTAQADEVACSAETGALIAAIGNADSLSNKDMASLTRKADSALDKLEAGKFEDALQKLADYEASLDKLAATIGTGKDKISAGDEAALRSALDAATACVSGHIAS